ncbi:hypothetical protein KP509_37G027700 [Ceratopteris richardii]|uniref:Uncharacterized protein n=1 Tax=Ceratopteris richardii TaxID=49495 RepID=A0A8T2Q7D9_CERRI|nr:hypothetical protein KP509_37G027700 [Ceratopteris richardii]
MGLHAPVQLAPYAHDKLMNIDGSTPPIACLPFLVPPVEQHPLSLPASMLPQTALLASLLGHSLQPHDESMCPCTAPLLQSSVQNLTLFLVDCLLNRDASMCPSTQPLSLTYAQRMAFLCLIITEAFMQIAPSILGPSSSLPAASLSVPFPWRHMATLLLLLDFYQSIGSYRPTVTSTLAASFCGHGPDLSASLIYDSLDSSDQSTGQCLQPLMQPSTHASGHAGPLCAPAAPTGAPATSDTD